MSGGGVRPDPWAILRTLTDARIALGRSGVSQPTRAQLAFQLAHASARDAVHAVPDWARIEAGLAPLFAAPLIPVASRAADRATYLQRPDLGRRLREEDVARLAACPGGADVAFAVVDGLSARAIERQTVPLLAALLPRLQAARWTVAPCVLVRQGRVAIGDEIGAALSARIVVVLIGERPGLSSPDSLGVYFTHAPRPGLSDAARNCISNVRPEGLAPAEAANKLFQLLQLCRQRAVSGVALKDETPVAGVEDRGGGGSFLVGPR